MARKTERKGLGRGLSALLAETELSQPDTPQKEQASGRTDKLLPIEDLHPNPDQPRRDFLEADIDELAKSIERNGIIQPLIVRTRGGNKTEFEIVAGERRWRAAQRAKVHEVPVIIREFTDEEVLEVAIIENIQRVDLNPIEEALGYRQLMDRFGHTQDAVAQALGKSRSHIANLLRLLSLPETILDHLRAGRLSMGHARALITAQEPGLIAERVISEGLSVRQTEALARQKQTDAPKNRGKTARHETKDADTRAIEGELSAHLGMSVQLDHGPTGDGGFLRIRYKSLDDLDKLMEILSGN